MDIVELAIWLIIIIAIIAVVIWFWRRSKIVIPPPFDIVAYAVFAILAILALVWLARKAGAFSVLVATALLLASGP